MKVLKMFKKWLLNCLDSLLKTLKNTDSLTKIFFAFPTLLLVGTTTYHVNVGQNLTVTANIPAYLGIVFVFLSFLFSIVIAYVGMGYVQKRKISSFILLMVFEVIFLTFSILYLSTAISSVNAMTSDSDAKKYLTPSMILYFIAMASSIAGSVLAALKIDPTYYKERNN